MHIVNIFLTHQATAEQVVIIFMRGVRLSVRPSVTKTKIRCNANAAQKTKYALQRTP